MISQISVGENVCYFKETSSSMDPNSAIVKLSASVQSSEPFSEIDDKLSESMVTPNVSGTDVLVTAFDDVNTAELSEQKHEKRSGIPKADDASEIKCPDIVCMAPPRRSGRKSLLLQNQVNPSVRNAGRTAAKRATLDINNLNIIRRKRTSSRKPTRSSVWTSLGNDIHTSEHGEAAEVVKSDQRKSRRAKRGQKSEKHDNNQAVQNLQTSMAKNRICLKVKFGQRSLMDVLPLIGNANGTYSSTSKEPVRVPESICDQFEDEMNKITGLNGINASLDSSFTSSDASVTNMCPAGKNVDESPTEKYSESHNESPTLAEAGKLGTPVDDRCSNPGTSPDSEVINLIPDAHISLKGLDNLHGLMPIQASDAPEDFASFGIVENCHIKGKKKDRLVKTVDCSVKATFPSSEIINNEQPLGQLTLGEFIGDGSYSDRADTYILTTSKNASGSVSGTELCPGEPEPLSKVDDFGRSSASPMLEHSAVVNLCSSLDTPSPDLQMPEKSLSSTGKLKLSKKGKSKGVGKSQSETFNSSSRANSSKTKVNKGKKSGKCEVKKKPHGVQGLTELGNDPEPENQTSSQLGQIGSGIKITCLGTSNQTEGHTESISLRNAWVQCDDCQKWRRIPAVLADQIEETNCKWICKDNMDKDFADCSIPQEKSNSAINAELEISDVSGDEDASHASLNHNCSGKKSTVDQSSSWTLIKSNLFLHRAHKSQTIDEVMVCHCKPPSDGQMGCGDGCLNRMLNIECVQGTCPCGELCSNQQFQRRNYAKLKWFKCGKKGYGLQLLEDVSEGQFLIEYVGEVLDMQAYEGRQCEYASKGHRHFYFMTLNGSEVIDACAKGNLGRFINHSCDPNCSTEKWMVNGEVCIGLFALRDIKKGEEVTFDYNYVRVFGAAAKRCVCGSPQCRGYIGGDTLNAEVIVQDDSDDEYPEPVVECEEIDMYDELNYIKSSANSFSDLEMRTVDEASEYNDILVGHGSVHTPNSVKTKNGDITCPENFETNKSAAAIECLNTSLRRELLDSSVSSAVRVETSVTSGGLQFSGAKEEGSEGEKVVENSVSPVELEVTSSPATLSKPLKKSKSGCVGGKAEGTKSCPLVKASRRSSSVKKAKSKSIKAPLEIGNRSKLPEHKFKKPPEGSLNGRFEAVEEKLNELLDPEGGISKRKDASRCYLKLLLLTAVSGGSGNSETIQSNRELSMILDALLKTKSRTVLVDVINKNGLQMLHNIMKRYRREFNKIPILRKLLKVLEYLAMREILTFEHINGGPSRPGVESFRDSILTLTEHIDKQVHQIARSFRDRWIPRLPRKSCFMDKDDGRIEFHSHSTVGSNAADACALDGSTVSCSGLGVSNGTKTRKRKSRWDQEAEPKDDCEQDKDDAPPPGYEFPPGFSAPINNPKEHCASKQPVTGHCQQKFIPHLPVSYGIPFNVVQQFGTPQIGTSEVWAVAPGIPFQSFPPLPTCPRGRMDNVPPLPSSQVSHQPAQTPPPQCHKIDPMASATTTNNQKLNLELNPPSQNCFQEYPCHTQNPTGRTSGANLPPEVATGEQRPNGLGRRYFRQQKWSGSKPPPPWLRMRNGWGYNAGNNPKNVMCNVGVGSVATEFRSSHGPEDVGMVREGSGTGPPFSQN
nr:histone-lysine N-methyltransferase ASHH2-like [Ipomoea batatas]